MPANIDALIREAQTALQQNRKADARQALDTALSIDEMSENAWFLMSKVVDTVSDQQTCLENVLAINPNNTQAKQALATLQGGGNASPFAPAPAPVSPFGDTSASDWGDWASFDVPDPSASPAKPKAANTTPSSVEWGAPAEANPADSRAVNQPSDVDYDSWMAGLQLGGSSSRTSSDKQSANPGLVPAFDTSDFDSGPFSSTSFAPFSTDDSVPPANDPATSPFGGFSFDDPPVSPAVQTQSDADPFGLRRGSGATTSNPTTDSAAPASEGTSFSLKGAEAPALAAARKRQANDQTFDDYQQQLEDAEKEKQRKAAPAARSSARSSATAAKPIVEPSSNAAVFTTIDSSPGMSNPSSYFSAIPEDIRDSSKLKPMLIASLVGLVVVNLLSLLFLISNLAASGNHP